MNFETDFKKELIQKFKNKNLSDSSINMYVRNLEKLNDDTPLKNLNFLKKKDDIMSKLEKYKENTKRSYLISICSALSLDKDSKSKKNLYDYYFDLMVNKNKELKELEHQNIKSETQSKNWVEWNEVGGKLNTLKEKVDKFKNSKEINEHNYNTLLEYMILSLYYYKQPRRNMDYQKMKVVKYNNSNLPISSNYLVYNSKLFIFNIFKTSKKEGQQVEDIPEDLFNIIKLYFKFHPYFKEHPIKSIKKETPIDAYFLVYYNGNPLEQVNSITRIINKIFENKSVGSSILRHSFLSNKHQDTIEELKEDAKAMGHSVSQALDYVKVPNKKK
jgi:hypothetical protein